MAINLEKYKEQNLSAWREVIDDKSATNWVLFSYEGQTNDLKVVSKGDGGIEELRDDLNSSKIMYAFCRVLDPKTSLFKFVLINWTGEGAPNLRKGTCANHIRDVERMLKGAHLTISARNEEEVDLELIIEKVSKATGSSYSFKERGETAKSVGPVGTTYKRVIPQQEIDAKERDKFWQKEEEEEKKRQEEERRHKDEERKKLENERQQRELKEAETREARIQERNNSISALRAAERLEKEKEGINRPIEVEDDREKEEQERKNRSEQLRRQRSQEAQALISKRTIDARAVFEQNTSVGQLHQKKTSYQPSQSDKVRWPPQPVHQDPEPVHNNVTQTQAQPHTPTHVEPKSPVSIENITENIIVGEEAVKSNKEETIVESIVADPYTNGGEPEENYGLRAQALYDYQAADDTEISFDPGDIITHIDQIDAGWWQGLDPQGNFGLFPANYVQLLD